MTTKADRGFRKKCMRHINNFLRVYYFECNDCGRKFEEYVNEDKEQTSFGRTYKDCPRCGGETQGRVKFW